MPSTTSPKTTNGSLSCVAELSFRLMNTCVVRPFGILEGERDGAAPVRDALVWIVGDGLGPPRLRDLRVARDPELRPRALANPEDRRVVVVAGW